jgi:hypothetical protein
MISLGARPQIATTPSSMIKFEMAKNTIVQSVKNNIVYLAEVIGIRKYLVKSIRKAKILIKPKKPSKNL